MKEIEDRIYNFTFSRQNFRVPVDLKLELNKTLEANVIDCTTSWARLRIGGKNLSCKTKVTLNPGDKIKLLVKEITKDTIIMQLVSKSSSLPQSNEKIRDILINLGFHPNKENLEIVKNLMKYNLLINRENIENIQNFLSILPYPSNNMIDYITYLYSLGLTNLLKLPDGFFLPRLPFPFNSTIKNLADLILNILNNIKLISNKEPQLINYIQETLHSIILTGTTPKDLEQELKFYLFPEINKNIQFYRAIQVVNKLSDTSSTPIEELIKSFIEVCSSIYQQQLIAAASLKSFKNLPLYFQVPWYFDERWHNLQLKINPQKSGKKINPDFLTIVFLIELSHLRYLKIILQIYGKKINLQIFTENKRVKTFLEEYIKELKVNLGDLDYQLTDVECKVAENLSSEAQEFHQLEISKIKDKVDVKA